MLPLRLYRWSDRIWFVDSFSPNLLCRTVLTVTRQTDPGKSYSMMGYGSDRGIIPLICEALFERIREREEKEEGLKFTVEVSLESAYHAESGS